MWPAIAGILFVIVVVLGAYLWVQPAESQPTTVIYEDDSVGWWPWIPRRHPHHTPRHWLGPGGTEWHRPHMLGPGGLAPTHRGMGSPHRNMSSPHRGMGSPHRNMSSPHRGMAPPHRGRAFH